MRQIWMLAGIGALAGAAGGAMVAMSWAAAEAESVPRADLGSVAPEAPAHVTPEGLLQRLEAVELAVRRLQAASARAASARRDAEGQASDPAEPSPLASAPAAVADDPVFEAAVLDVLERAEEERDAERDSRRSERAQQRAEHWSRELTAQLGLSPRQAAQLLEIRSRLMFDLREQRRALSEGPFVSREERRAAADALRARADQALRDLLDARQLRLYEQLDDKLKLLRSAD